MTAARLDLTIEQGADYDTPFTIQGPTGAPLNLTGYGAALQIRPDAGYPFAVLTLTSVTGGLRIEAAAGKVIPVIPPSVSAAIHAGRYVYDLKLVSPSGKVTRAYQGAVYVSDQVTEIVILPPSAYGAILLEDGSYLLMEAGGKLLIDDGIVAGLGSLLTELGGYLLDETGGKLLLEA